MINNCGTEKKEKIFKHKDYMFSYTNHQIAPSILKRPKSK